VSSITRGALVRSRDVTRAPPPRTESGPQSVAALERALASAEARLQDIANTDPLTELLNRRGLQASLTAAIHATGTGGLYVLLVDLDDFRAVNDLLGHVAGDVILREVGQLVARALGTRVPVGRIGGDEFLALLPESNPDEALRVAEALRLAIGDTTIALGSGPRRVTASVAMTAVNGSTPSIDEVLTSAYQALTQSKRGGKNKVSATMDLQALNDPLTTGVSRIVAEVKRGRGLRAVMQPVMSIPEGVPVGFELLSRSTVDVFEMPNDLFRMAHEANILTLVDHRCWKTCLAATAQMPKHLMANVNLFPSTLLAIPVDDLLRAVPEERSLSSYCVEISESQIIGDPTYLLGPVSSLRGRGLKIAIDDVGFGRTCLESLIVLEPDVLKLDRRTVTGAGRDARQRRSLERLLGVARALEAEVVAEGVETEEDLHLIVELGIGLAQGYFWGRPQAVRYD